MCWPTPLHRSLLQTTRRHVSCLALESGHLISPLCLTGMKPFTDAFRRAVAPLSLKVDTTAAKVDATAAKVAELAADQKQTAAEHKQLSASVQSALVMSSHAFAKATTALSSTSMDRPLVSTLTVACLFSFVAVRFLSCVSDGDDANYYDGGV